MCGIYGIARHTGRIDKHQLTTQCDRLRHRGPDDAGVWLAPSGDVGLGHRRLAILDLSAAGHQPMHSADGRYTIVFNGEIYNFEALRAELRARGETFVGHSDTEVLLAAYRAWGESFLSRLNGMFAFAIHDAGSSDTRPSLFLARDRTGEKPLFYALEDGQFEFASELKAMSLRGSLDLRALNHYLALGYVPRELCIAARVRKLPAAHAMYVDLTNLVARTWRYWTLPSAVPDTDADGERLADEAGTLLESSVRQRLVADVPVGVLLSGGMDSSLIVAAAARQSAAAVKTFTVTLPGSRLDESAHARQVARHFSTDHHELPLADMGLSIFDEMAPWIDEPIGDSSMMPSFMVSRLTRRHVTVALGGDGGDELFGGYLDYPTSLADAARLGWLPQPLFALAAKAASALPAGIRGRNRLASLREGPLKQMIWGRPHFDVALRKRVLHGDAVRELGSDIDEPENFLGGLFAGGRDAVDAMTRTHFGAILSDDFLVKVDRASMAVGLEMRAPFLDHRLIEFAFGRVPSRWKVSGNQTRRLQRLLARRWLPPALDIDRKQGFSIPLDAWLRAESETALAGRFERLPSCIDRGEVARLTAGLRKGRANGTRLFTLMMLSCSNANLGLSV